MSYGPPDGSEASSFASFIDWEACEGIGGWVDEPQTRIFQEPELAVWDPSFWNLSDAPSSNLPSLNPFIGSDQESWPSKLDNASTVCSTADISMGLSTTDSRSFVTPCSTLLSTESKPVRCDTGVSNASQPKRPSLSCTHPDCSQSPSFRRLYELERHIRVHHRGLKPFECPVPACFRGRDRTSFSRADKLTTHIRAAHARYDQWVCPFYGCRIGALAPELMYVHLQSHCERTPTPDGRAMCNGLSPAYRHCPLWSCGSVIRLTVLLTHINCHSKKQLESIAAPLLSMSLVSHDGKINIQCPICSILSTDLSLFYQHLIELHILTDSAHTMSWRQYIQDHPRIAVIREGGSEDWSFTWEPWPLSRKDSTHDLVLCCPFCKVEENVATSGHIEHHLSILASDERIRKCRLQILRLWPEFATHPVFDDLRSDEHLVIAPDSKNLNNGVPDARANMQVVFPPVVAASNADILISEREQHEMSVSRKRRIQMDEGPLRNITELPASGDFFAVFNPDFQNILPDHEGLPSYDMPGGNFKGGSPDEGGLRTQPDLLATYGTWPTPVTSRNDNWYGCKYEGCTTSFRRLRDLNQHERLHFNQHERPHACARCNLRFLSPKDLRRHFRVHEKEGAREFKCEVEGCEYHDRGFKRKDHLARHRSLLHESRKAESSNQDEHTPQRDV